MNQNEFGAKVRKLREEKGLTREAFCEDEIELTVRQLTRIESGDSKPTLTKMQFIAGRLGLTLFQLMPDYIALPAEYKRLKYDIIRRPSYSKQEAVDTRDDNITKIYDEFYDRLPEEERLITDLLRSIFDVRDTKSDVYGQEILDEYFEKAFVAEICTVTDLLVMRLFIERFRMQSVEKHPEGVEILKSLSKKVITQSMLIPSDELFILRDLIFAIIGTAGEKEIYDDMLDLIICLEQIMQQTQDFQKMPILKLVTWKYHLYVTKDKKAATTAYEQGIVSAQMLGDGYLLGKLQEEWEEDREL